MSETFDPLKEAAAFSAYCAERAAVLADECRLAEVRKATLISEGVDSIDLLQHDVRYAATGALQRRMAAAAVDFAGLANVPDVHWLPRE